MTNLAVAVTSLVGLVSTSVIVVTVALMSKILLFVSFILLLFRRLWGARSMRLRSFVQIMIFPKITVNLSAVRKNY